MKGVLEGSWVPSSPNEDANVTTSHPVQIDKLGPNSRVVSDGECQQVGLSKIIEVFPEDKEIRLTFRLTCTASQLGKDCEISLLQI